MRKELSERENLEPNTRQRESIDEDLIRINRYLEQKVQPPTLGIAIFACSGAKDFFEALQFEAPAPSNAEARHRELRLPAATLRR